MNTLLVEIGVEEIPSSYVESALKAFSALLAQKMAKARIKHGAVKTFGTPRRLAVEIQDVADKQESLKIQVLGPPEKIGFDEHGNFTIAAKKFAEKVGIHTDSLQTKQTKKGSYLFATKTEDGLLAEIILQKILPDAIKNIPFPKTMRWADLTIEFARPIHSILAILGGNVISFKLGNIESGRRILGHSFMSSKMIEIINPNSYVETLRLAYVVVDIKERKKNIKREIAKAANRVGGKILLDNELVDIVTNLVEYPIISIGQIDKKFLELPDEILITAMREHQKYFGVIDEKGALMSWFIVVNNTRAKNMDIVSRGHERVLRARLEDAKFFYENDIAKTLDDFTEKLNGVLFQAKLGSMRDKTVRIQKLAEFMANEFDNEPNLKRHVSRAAWLCKADLTSQVVVEFPKLQGIIGRIYASIAKEHDAVACAIEEHYRPTYSGGQLPVSLAGAILSIADKIDSICGCFSIGLMPTGTSDPYALRRQGIGVIQIMLERKFAFSIGKIIEKSLELYETLDSHEIKENVGKVHTFLQNRIIHCMVEEGFSKDVIAAVASVSIDNVPNVWNRAHSLEKLKKEPDFEPIAIAFKRVANIIKKADGCEIKDIDENLFQDKCESELYFIYKEVKNKVIDNLNNGCFDQALLDIASMRNFVDSFFDKVMVMSEDMRIRCNRLALLQHIEKLFKMFADFSKIST